MKVLKRNILVARKEAPATTASGLYIPPTGREPQFEATVISVGSKVTEVKEGDVVLIGKYSGHNINGQLLLNVDDVLAVLEPDAPPVTA